MRDNFSKPVKEILAKRVGYNCSNPKCRRKTVGPHSNEDSFISIGVAAHISAASIGGPRYNSALDTISRKSISNGIWLCQSCSKLIDSDVQLYTIDVLLKWKNIAEKETHSTLTENNVSTPDNTISLFEKRISTYENLYYEMRNAASLISKILEDQELELELKKEAIFYIGLQVAKYSTDNSFYMQNEIELQCIATFGHAIEIPISSNQIDEERKTDYIKNLRASYKLLKSINEKGLINTRFKTPIMKYYSQLEEEGKDDEFLS